MSVDYLSMMEEVATNGFILDYFLVPFFLWLHNLIQYHYWLGKTESRMGNRYVVEYREFCFS